MNNEEKEKWLAQQEASFFNNLPSNYDQMMAAISEVPAQMAIGNPKKILQRAADPEQGLGEAGLLVFEEGEGVKPHTHVEDTETYTFADGSQEKCEIGQTHEITPRLTKCIIKFDKQMNKYYNQDLSL